MRKHLFGLIIAIIMLAASPALASMSYIYGGSQITAGTTATTTTYNDAGAAYTDFSGRYAGILTETFENFGSLVNQPNTLLPVGDTATGTPFGTITSGSAGYVGSTTTNQVSFHEGPLTSSEYYFSNGTPNADQPKGSFTLNLNQSYRALGFYASDWHDIGGTTTLDISGTDTTGAAWSQTIDVLALTGTMTSGSLVYFSLFSDLGFDTVTFNTTSGDGYGIDNLSVGSPTPIPGAIWLLGSGLIGLVGIRRRFA